MKDDALKQVLSNAILALNSISPTEWQQLSRLECAYVLSALSDTGSLATLRSLLARRLHGQMSSQWIEHGDAGEVYAALAALWRYDQTNVRGEWLAAAIQRLVQSEAAVGGPYYTDNNTVDIAANIQIATFIGVVAKPLPNMDDFFADVIDAERFGDTKFTHFGLFYALAEAGNRRQLTHYVKGAWQQREWHTPWHAAIALDIFKEEARTPEIEQTLLEICAQQRDGLWDGEPLLADAPTRNYLRYSTTALIAGVLTSYLCVSIKRLSSGLRRKRQTVARAAKRMFLMHPEPLRSTACLMVDRVCEADTNFEITLLPQFFARALDVHEHRRSVSYTNLGLANLYVWIAYTIYDDFIDNEGTPAELPVANIAMRASLDCYRTMFPDDAHFQHRVAKVFAGMDEANAWEVDNCRFTMQGENVVINELPKYGRGTVLAARAFAHALTPMAILARYVPDAPRKSRHIEIAFQHYLIARQLNDDLHDWPKDMQAGQSTYVVTAILRDMHVKHAAYNLDALLPAMQRCFRRTTMQKLCKRMLHHITASRQYFAKSQLLQPTNEIYILLDTLELSAHQSMDMQVKSRALSDINPSA